MSATCRVLKTKGHKITSRFGPRTITYTSGPDKGKTVTKNHNGVDVVGTGSTLDHIIAHTAGTVQAAGFDSAVGYYVNVETAPGVVMVYYHMKEDSLAVKKGDKVKTGQTLGYMGATGNVTGAHLHFGIKAGGSWIDPEPYLNADYKGKGGDIKMTLTTRVLKRGCTGEDVRALQILLNGNGCNCGNIDGDFGPKTAAAVMAYQRKTGLAVDGSAGPATQAKILGIK